MIKTKKPVDLNKLQKELAQAGFEYHGLNGSPDDKGNTLISGVQIQADGMGINVDIPSAAQKVLDAHTAG